MCLHTSLGTCNLSHVTSRRTAQVAATVEQSIAAAGISHEIVAQAADLSIHDLEQRLQGAIPFEISVLAEVGGLLRVPTTRFLEGVA